MTKSNSRLQVAVMEVGKPYLFPFSKIWTLQDQNQASVREKKHARFYALYQ